MKIDYNELNLPSQVKDHNNNLKVDYLYDVQGRKLRKQSPQETRHYVNGIEYMQNGTGATVDFLHMQEGIARNIGGTYHYEYFLKDHLGNTRVVYNEGSAVLQQTDYYPFGMEINRKVSSPKIQYTYNGKEFQEELNQYDYGARFYDPVLGRWSVVDPLAEKYVSSSPFNYVDNNPVNRLDPDGKSWSDWNDMWANNFGGMSNPWNNDWMSTENDPFYFEDSFEFALGDQDDPKKKKSVDISKVGTGFDLLGLGLTLGGNYQSESLFRQGIRGGVSGNYQLTGSNLSYFGNQTMTSASKPYTMLGKMGSIAYRGGTVVGGLGVFLDGVSVYKGELSLSRFGYRASGYGASLGAASIAGGPYGFAVGLGFLGGEIAYDTNVKVKNDFQNQFNQFYNTLINSWGNRIR